MQKRTLLSTLSRSPHIPTRHGARHLFHRSFTSTLHHKAAEETDITRTRNIGIIAHIDAGKTTTTERMLYYSGYTRRLGDVDEGSTVTDFLPAERARGITIQSAAITFHWPPLSRGTPSPPTHSPRSPARPPPTPNSTPAPATASLLPRHAHSHTINLIDTPGHADFTFEVIRSLRILDGAICILDGVAGVEAQTEQVWKQADALAIPRLIFVNKLDRDGAAYARTVREIAVKLRGWPALCQIPWWEGGKFVGVGDVVGLRGMRWGGESGDGTEVETRELGKLRESVPAFAEELLKARAALVDALSEFDEVMVEHYLEKEDAAQISPDQIVASLRRCTLDGSAQLIPVFCGASFRNIGVQPLLDAVNDLLPSPSDRPPTNISAGSSSSTTLQSLKNAIPSIQQPLGKRTSSIAAARSNNHPSPLQACALAFKVVADPRRGLLTYVRVYSGSITRSAVLYNTALGTTERATRLLRMYASDAIDIPSIDDGQIGVIPGLKHARTGDTLIVCQGVTAKNLPEAPFRDLQLRPIEVPPPVFFASLEPASLSEEKTMKENLDVLLREDPSLRVTTDEENGQTMISGMGELHLEIARDRLVGEFGTRADMGSVRVAYRECPTRETARFRIVFDQEINGVRRKAACEIWLEPKAGDYSADANAAFQTDPSIVHADGNSFKPSVVFPETSEAAIERILPGNLDESMISAAMMAGASAALAIGPRFHVPMHTVMVHLKFDVSTDFFSDVETIAPAIGSAARQATYAALRSLCPTSSSTEGTALMDPLMNVDIAVDEENLGTVVGDIGNARGGQILSLGDDSGADVLANDVAERSEIDSSRVYTPPDPFASGELGRTGDNSQAGHRQRMISALIPLKEMVGYLKYLRSMTKGRGSFTMSLARFERMSKQRERNVLKELSGF